MLMYFTQANGLTMFDLDPFRLPLAEGPPGASTFLEDDVLVPYDSLPFWGLFRRLVRNLQ